ncbi:rhamnosyltransferase WsaF family glycosyltransferase [Actibacterium sp. D379-3]
MAPEIVVVVAVYHPDPSHFAAQLDSIARQTHPNISVLFVAADTTSAPLIKTQARAAGLLFETVTPAAPMDAVRAFEFGLSEAIARAPGVQFFALADQDDIWHRDKLALSLEALKRSGADLAHSDARVVDAAGRERHASLFRLENRQTAPGLRDLLYRNTVTGMTMLMTRRLVETALPFPPQDGVHYYHDLWLALVGTVLSQPVFLKQPLVAYRQHGGNAVGAIEQPAAPGPALGRHWLRQRAASYALAMYLARSLVLRLGQEPAHLARLAPLRPFLRRLSAGPRFIRDAARLALIGKAQQSRIALSYAVIAAGRSVWALRHALHAGLDSALQAFDQRAYSLSPGQMPCAPRNPPPAAPAEDWTHKTDPRTIARWHPVFSADAPALVVLVPTLNPAEIFAGIATALEFGLAVAARGIPVRFVATDLPIAAQAAARAFLLHRLPAGADRTAIAARLSLHCGVSEATLPCHPDDMFFATAWWTAHIAQAQIDTGGFAQDRFFYLIQDYEPNFYPWGAEYAGAVESYGFRFIPIFNSAPLRRYFADQGFDFATPAAMVFRPSIDIARYAGLPDRRTARKRIALYGRPEVARNMFPQAIGALGHFLQAENLTRDDVSLVSVGLKHGDLRMPGELRLESLGKLPWSDYPDFLSTVDLGLSLMYSPHPSHLPLEMAAAGAKVVTNHFGPKDLSCLSPAIHSCAPTVPALTETLRRAWAAPAPDRHARDFDLAPLGPPLQATADRLAATIRGAWALERKCA